MYINKKNCMFTKVGNGGLYMVLFSLEKGLIQLRPILLYRLLAQSWEILTSMKPVLEIDAGSLELKNVVSLGI